MDNENLKPKDKPGKKRWKIGRLVLRKRQIIVVLLEVVAVGTLLLTAASALFVWRLMSGPVDMGYAKSYIQEALRVPEQGLTPTVDDIVLSWPDLSGPILLGFKNAKLYNPQGQAIVAVDEAALSLSKASLLIGRIAPIALIVRGPVVQVVRTETGSIQFGIVGVETQPDAYGPHSDNEDTGIERIMRYISRPGRDHSGLGTLEAIRIEGARAVIEDRTMDTSWVLPRMDAAFESHDDGVKADIYLQFSEADESAYFLANMQMPWDTKQSKMKAELKGFDPWFFVQRIEGLKEQKKGDAIFDGKLAAIIDAQMRPVQGIVQLSSRGGTITSKDLSKTPIEYKNFNVHAAYDKAKGKLQISDTTLTMNDIPLEARALIDIGPAKISGPVQLEVKGTVPQSKMGEIWPPFLEGDNAQEWIVHKLSEGTFSDVYANLKIEGTNPEDAGWSFDVPDVAAGFSFSGMKVEYRPPLSPVTQGKGKGVFNLAKDRLDIEIESGKIGGLTVGASKLAFVDIVAKGKGSADLHVALKGPLGAALEYVELEPIHVKHKYDAKQVKGDTDLKVDLAFPTRKDIKIADVKIAVNGTLSNVFLPGVVKDMSLIGGPLALKVEGNDLNVKGKGELGGRPIAFEYKEFLNSDGQLYKNSVTANLNTDEATRERLGIDLKDFIDGNAPVDVTYTEYEGERSVADVKADLAPTHLFIEPFDYDKKPGAGGAVALKATLQDGHVTKVEGLEVTADGLDLSKGNLSFRGESKLAGGEIGAFVIGETKGSMNFTVDESGRYNVNANTSFFDLRPFLDDEKPKPPEPDDHAMLIKLDAAQMRGADGKPMPAGRFLIDMTAQGIYNKLEVDATAGQGPVTLRLNNDGGVRTFTFDAGDAGSMMRSFGIYQNIRGGVMSVRGAAKTPGEMDMKGEGLITDFRVVNAPTLARLVSAMSLPGLASLLNGEGLAFSKLEADYKWHSQPGGSVLEIDDGATSGNSVGFSFEGTINLVDSTLNISGTMVPLSEVNKVLKKIPIVGDILTGGSGLIAATYTVKGPTEKPNVMVNPLSVLTPGILRRILFEHN